MTNTTIEIENIAAQAMTYALSYIKTNANRLTQEEMDNVYSRGGSSYRQAMDSRNEVINIARKNSLGYRNIFEQLIYAKKYNVGNCGESAILALEFMPRNYPDINAEVFSIENGDHVFGVINRRADSDPADPSTWGDDCWFCDPWDRKCGKASELMSFLKNLAFESNGEIFGLNTEPLLKLYCSGSTLLEIMKDDLSQGLDDLIKALNSMSSCIEKVIKASEKSPNKRLNNWLKNEKQKIDDLLSKTETQEKIFLNNREKYDYLKLEQKFYKIRDDLVKPTQKIANNVLGSQENIGKIIPSSIAMEELCNVADGFEERVSLMGLDFPDAPKTTTPNGESKRSFAFWVKARGSDGGVIKLDGNEHSRQARNEVST